MAIPSEPIGQQDLTDVEMTFQERELFDSPRFWERFEPNLISERDGFGAIVFMVTVIAHGALLAYAFAPPTPADHHMEAWRTTAAILGVPFLFSLFFYQRFVGLMVAIAMAVAVLSPTDVVVVDLEKWRKPAKVLMKNWAWLNTKTFPLWALVYGGLWLPIVSVMGLFRRPSRKVLEARALARWERLWAPEYRRRERMGLASPALSQDPAESPGEPSKQRKGSIFGLKAK